MVDLPSSVGFLAELWTVAVGLVVAGHTTVWGTEVSAYSVAEALRRHRGRLRRAASHVILQ